MRIPIIILLLTVLVLGCAKTSVKNDLPIGEPFVIKYQQRLENGDQHITLLFDSVRNDSRCPANVNCISAGNAEVKFIMGISKIESTFLLNTHIDPKKSPYIPYTIELISLSPGNKPLIPSDYTAQVKIMKN